jgi:hypothetical protein
MPRSRSAYSALGVKDQTAHGEGPFKIVPDTQADAASASLRRQLAPGGAVTLIDPRNHLKVKRLTVTGAQTSRAQVLSWLALSG